MCQIQYSAKADTSETVVQVREHNAVFANVCKEKKPCKIDQESVQQVKEYQSRQ